MTNSQIPASDASRSPACSASKATDTQHLPHKPTTCDFAPPYPIRDHESPTAAAHPRKCGWPLGRFPPPQNFRGIPRQTHRDYQEYKPPVSPYALPEGVSESRRYETAASRSFGAVARHQSNPQPHRAFQTRDHATKEATLPPGSLSNPNEHQKSSQFDSDS